MKTNLKYFLSKRGLSLRKYVESNNISSIKALRKNLRGTGVAIPEDLESQASGLFSKKVRVVKSNTRPPRPKSVEADASQKPAQRESSRYSTKSRKSRRSRNKKAEE